MIEIEKLESFLWSFFGEQFAVHAGAETYLIQDLGPKLADFLHASGVAIDWSDGSRYGTALPADSKSFL